MTISARRFAALAFSAVLACAPAHASIILFSGGLDAGQVVAGGGSSSLATGFGVVAVDTTLFTVTTELTWSGLSGPADRAHLHNGLEGQLTDLTFEHELLGGSTSPTRTIACPWSPYYDFCVPATGSRHDFGDVTSPTFFVFASPDFNSLLADFLQNGMYIDVHTELYPGGEIRGQMIEQVPEPATMTLVFLGLVVSAVSVRVKKRERSIV
jgi:hypothetical protein